MNGNAILCVSVSPSRSRTEGTRRMNQNESRRVELYVRSLAPGGTRHRQDAIVERLLALERRDIVDEIDLTVWGKAVCLDGTSAHVGTGARIAERIRAFHRWCEDGPSSLDPFFTWSAVDSSISGESFHRVVPPHRCLAVYVGDRLADLYPRRVDGDVRSLEDGLRSLEGLGSRRSGLSTVLEEIG